MQGGENPEAPPHLVKGGHRKRHGHGMEQPDGVSPATYRNSDVFPNSPARGSRSSGLTWLEAAPRHFSKDAGGGDGTWVSLMLPTVSIRHLM